MLGENLTPINGAIDYSDAFEETEGADRKTSTEFFGLDSRKTFQEDSVDDSLKKAYNFYSDVPQRKVNR